MSLDFWKRITFTNESKFEIFRNDELPKCGERRICYFKKRISIWGYVNVVGARSLYFTDGIMNHNMYINILKQNLYLSAEKMDLKDNFILVQDNDPKHTY